MEMDLPKRPENTITIIRRFGAFTLEEEHEAPTTGASGKELLFTPTISVKVIGIHEVSPHVHGT